MEVLSDITICNSPPEETTTSKSSKNYAKNKILEQNTQQNLEHLQQPMENTHTQFLIDGLKSKQNSDQDIHKNLEKLEHGVNDLHFETSESSKENMYVGKLSFADALKRNKNSNKNFQKNVKNTGA